MRRRVARQSRQRGVAVITALLLTTLAVTLVSSLFWQQQVQVRSIENQRLQLQKEWIVRGALDWAGAILRIDASGSNTVDYLGQPWSVPLADTRLDGYVDDDPVNGGSGAGEVVLSGNIVDAQSRYNLTNLSTDGVVNPVEVATFQRLLTNLHLPPDLAVTVATSVAAAQPTKPQTNQPTATSATSTNATTTNATSATSATSATGGTSGTLPLLHVEDLLALPGISPEMVRSLKDFVVVLPVPTPVNLNTASAEVLAACFDSMSQSDAASLIASRAVAYFRDAVDFSTRLPGSKAISATSNAEPVAFSTSFFLVNGKVRMGRATSNTMSLIKRETNHSKVLWTREL